MADQAPTRSDSVLSPPPKGHPASVLSLGETLIDLIVADGAGRLEDAVSFVGRPGGAPANVTVALARLGVASAFGGVVGDDPFGRRLRATLAGEGVDVSRLRATPEAATTLAFAWKDARGDGHFWLLRGADTLLSVAEVEAAGIERLAALVVGSVALAGEPSRSAIGRAVELATAAGVPVCFDVNLRPTLWPDLAAARAACAPIAARATLLKLSLDDARHLWVGGDPVAVVERLRREAVGGARLVVLTDGNRGAWYAATADAPVRHVPAFAVAAVEPTGAGDAFTAGLLSRLLASGWAPPTDEDLRYAAAAGALATTRPGALDGLPTVGELEAFLAGR
jgi:fructokinase